LLVLLGDGAGELYRGRAALDEVGWGRVFFGPGGIDGVGLPLVGGGVVAVAEVMPHQSVDGVVVEFLVEDIPEGVGAEGGKGVHGDSSQRSPLILSRLDRSFLTTDTHANCKRTLGLNGVHIF
jgi:hypothetical protein